MQWKNRESMADNIMGVAMKLFFKVRDSEGDTKKVDRVARPS